MRPANTETQASVRQIYAPQILRGTKGGIAGREEASYHLFDGSEAPAAAAAGASCEAGAAAARVRESSRRKHARELI
jgi:hypothetical protein